MTQEQAKRAVVQMYEDTSVRDELTDEEAKPFLKWAETEIDKLAARELDDEMFDEAYNVLRRLLVRINRFTARRVDMAVEEQQDYLIKFVELAGEHGVTLNPEQITTYLASQSCLDNPGNIQAMIAFIAPPHDPDISTAAVPPASTGEAQPNDQTLPKKFF